MTPSSAPEPSKGGAAALAAAVAALVASGGTALACVGPLVAILVGVGGFGWLTQYAYLRVPATIVTGVLLGIGFYWLYAGERARCAKRGKKSVRFARVALWVAAVLAVAVNVFEYLIFPRL